MTVAPTSPNVKRLYKLAERARWQFPLPPVASWLLRNGEFSPDDGEQLARRIGPESRLRSRLLSWCNSPLHNWSRKYPSLREASLVIGNDHMVRLAFLASIREFYLPNQQIGAYSREQLWQHGIAVGVVASFVARMSGHPNHLDAFIAGTLHDIGLLAMEIMAPASFSNWLTSSDAEVEDSLSEQKWFNTNHQDLGGLILKHWGLTDPIVQSARFHDRPTHIIDEEDSETCCCVAVADYLCSRNGMTASGTHNVLLPEDGVFKKLKMNEERLRIVWANLHPLLSASKSIR